jgi:hypothetical protein
MYEILVESYSGVENSKQVFTITTIENVLKEVKILFEKGFKIIKIINLTKQIELTQLNDKL